MNKERYLKLTKRTNIIDKDGLREQRRISMNALLNRPWIEKEKEPELYYSIKNQYQEIRDWFITYPGYSLIVNRRIAKLEKVPVKAQAWMGFELFKEPIDYALFTYGLWYLEGKLENEQFLLTDMVKEIRECMNEQGMEIDWKNYFHRLSMSRALKYLKSLGVLQSIDGQEVDWAANSDNNDVLYESNTLSRYVLRNFEKELSEYESMEKMQDLSKSASEDNKENQMKRYQLYRRYLIEPVVLNSDWKDDLFYFHGQKNNVIGQLHKMFGWEGSKYREGILFFYPELSGDMQLFPTLSSMSDVVVLLCGKIRDLYETEKIELDNKMNGTILITKSKIEHLLIELQEEYGTYWTKKHREMTSAQLAKVLCNHLIEWGFGSWIDDMHFLLYPITSRWNAEYEKED